MSVLDFDAPLFAPPEDILLAIFRPLEAEIPGLVVTSRIPDDEDMTTPMILCRSGTGSWNSDSFQGDETRFVRRFIADIQVFTDDPEGDKKAALLSELAYQRLRTVQRRQIVFPGLGHLAYVRTSTPAHQVPDWATSTGVNQYANLNKGMYRYEAKYGIAVRPDFNSPVTAEQILAVLAIDDLEN